MEFREIAVKNSYRSVIERISEVSFNKLIHGDSLCFRTADFYSLSLSKYICYRGSKMLSSKLEDEVD